MTSNFLLRLRILAGFFIVLIMLIALRLFSVQIVHSEDYKDRADRQYAAPASSLFERGSIFFTEKDGSNVSAATLKTLYKVAIKPKEISDGDATYAFLEPYVSVTREEFQRKAKAIDDPYEQVASRLPKSAADAIEAKHLPGVYVYKEKIRFYPGESLAAQTLGFVAYKGDALSGRYGIERMYDAILSRDSSTTQVNFFAEVFSNITKTIFKNPEAEGDIVLTLDPAIQATFEKTLLETKTKWNADAIGGIVINPIDGAIYAMAYLPTFDLNAFQNVDDPHLYANPNVENVYEFGSVIKPLTLSGGIDTGVIKPTTTYDDKGFVILNGKQINNFDKKARGPGTSMQDVLNESLNTGSVFVMQKMGHESFKKYMLSFGIGEKTGIDLPNETSGLISNLKTNRDLEYANAAFGQGIAITPIEAVRSFSAIANGGLMITPHLVSQINYTNGKNTEIEPKAGTRILKPETSLAMTEMLTIVAETMMKTYNESLPHYSIAVKTGTAQIAKADGTGYIEGQNLHSIFGYFPAYDPKFLTFVYMKNPKGAKFSAQTLSGPLLSTASFLLNYYDVTPDITSE